MLQRGVAKMYIEKDYFLSEYRKNFKTDKEVVDFIKKCFPDVEEKEIQGSYASYLYSFFGYVLYPFGVNAVASNIGYFGTFQRRNKISRHVSSGLLDKYSFKDSDMDCRNAYFVPKGRQDEISATLPFCLKNSLVLRRCNGKVPGHDYGLGLSILQFMMLGKPFEVLKEVNYASGIMKSRGSLCVDAQIHMTGGGYEIFIEQDMGTEDMETLAGKIFLYGKHEITGHRNCILFSSHKIMPYPICPTFRIKDMEKLYAVLKEEDVGSLQEYESLYLSDASEEIKSLFVKLGVRVGYYVAFKNRGRVDASKVDDNCVIERSRNGMNFTMEELRRYIDELMDGTNPYRQIAYNIRQQGDCCKKYQKLCSYISKRIHDGHFELKEVQTLLVDGLRCLMMPTVLLSRSYSYLEYDNSLRGLVENSLERYYPGIKEAEYRYTSPIIEIKRGMPFCVLNNCYRMPDGRYICVEHIGYDVGAFIRFYYLYLYCEDIGLPLHLVALVENEDEILFFSGRSEFYTSFTTVKDDNYFMSFMNLCDPSHKLNTVHYTENHGYRVVGLSTRKEIESIRNQIK